MTRLTREFFVEQTCKLLNERGRTDFALSEVLKACGAQKGSLYHFFPEGKDELVVAAVNHMSECAYAHVQACLESEETVADAVYKQVTELARWADTPGRLIAIPFSAIAAITGDTHADVTMACRRALDRLESAFVTRLKADGLKVREAKSVASFILAAIEGGFLLSRTHRTSQPLRLVASNLRDCIASFAE